MGNPLEAYTQRMEGPELGKAKGTGWKGISIYHDDQHNKALVGGINFDEVVGFYLRGEHLVFVMRGGGEVLFPKKWRTRLLGDGPASAKQPSTAPARKRVTYLDENLSAR